MLKKYFTYVPIWLSIIVNIILALLASVAFFIGLIFLMGLFSEPTLAEQILGWFIMLSIVVIIAGVNYWLYRICKKRRTSVKEPDKKKMVIKSAVIIAILVLGTAGFFLFPEIWLMLNGWWF